MLSTNLKAPISLALFALSLPLLISCSSRGEVKPPPPEVKVVRETPPAALLSKQARPAYQAARPWGELPMHAAELNVVIDGYECQIDRLVVWATGGDPAAHECKPAE